MKEPKAHYWYCPKSIHVDGVCACRREEETDERLLAAFEHWRTHRDTFLGRTFSDAFAAGAAFGAAQQRQADAATARGVAEPLLYNDGFVAYNACYLVADAIREVSA